MALANVAWILASAGKRVLVADWDLEAPGLHRFFAPFTRRDQVDSAPGVIDLVREFEDHVQRNDERPTGWVEQLARVDTYALSVDWEFPGGGSLDMLSAGRQNGEYALRLGSLDWDLFYERLGGGAFISALRADMRNRYDYTLIDSRTGFSDVADICTQDMPDVLVDCFTLSNQGIDGAAHVARQVARNKRRAIRILPVAMRVDQGEKEKADAGRLLAMRRFPGLPTGMSDAERTRFFASVEVPYQTYYAYEETLATFGDKPGSPTSVLAAYERLTAVITRGEVTALAPMDEALRTGWRSRFERHVPVEQDAVRLRYVAEDQVWAEWTGATLEAAGVTVLDDGPARADLVDDGLRAGATTLTVVSHDYVVAAEGTGPRGRWSRPELAMLVEDVRLREVAARNRVSIVGLDEAAAAERLLSLVGRSDGRATRRRSTAGRFPGTEPRWFRLPARNARFTGRTEELRSLRSELGTQGRAVVLPVALQGLGGIGKSQLALEYAHRFRTAYDLVWWIEADPPQFVDSKLNDIGQALGLPAEAPTSLEAAIATLDALRQGRVTRRWLLVFDNADDVEHVQRFLPQGGGGHVLLTSRNPGWQEHANSVQVDVFQREESIAHLRSRTSGITTEQAGQVAQALGDLPIAVSAGGAWLAETGAPVSAYLEEIQRHGTEALQAILNLSLQRLADQFPGAYRLLQLCSVMGPEIALDLVYSEGVTAALLPFDPSVSVRDERGALVQQINRLALLKLDTAARQVQVHRLLQGVVRSRMTDDEEARTRHETHLALAAFRPSGEPDDPRTWERFRMIWPHLEVSGATSCPDEAVRQLSIDRVRYLWRRGDFAQGLDLGTSVVKTWTALLAQVEQGADESGAAKADHEPLRRQLLHLRFNIANILRDQARFKEALALDEEVLAAQRALLGDRHSHTLMTSGGLAADLRALGRYDQALSLDEATYRAWLEGFGEDHPRTLAAANNLAASLRAVGSFRRAMAIDEDVLTRRRVVLGPAHPYALHSQSSLGRDLREAGEYERSVEILREVHEVSLDRLGPHTVGTLNAQTNLAASLRSAGHPDEAAGLLEDAYEKLSARFGADNPNTLACRLNRSTNLLATGQVDKAVKEMADVTAAYQKALDSDHPFTLVCVSNQSAGWRASGDLPRATELAETAAAGCRRLLGEEHPSYLAAAMNRATCRADAGDVESAATETAELAARMAEVLGDRHPDTLACHGNLALLTDGPPAAGTRPGPALARAIDDLAARLGDGHPSVRALREGRLLYRVTDPQDPF